MDKTEAQKTLNKFVRGMQFTVTQTVEMVNDYEGQVVLKTKCHDLFFDEFEESIYELADAVGNEFCSSLKSNFFDQGKYLGSIKRDTQSLNASVLDHIDITFDTLDKTEPESLFLDTILSALRIKSNSVNASLDRLKWKGSARKLGYIVSVLSDLDLIDTPTIGDQVNCKKLAEQTLGSFNVKSGLQTMRKAVDPDQNKLTSVEKTELFDQLKQAIKQYTEN